MSTEVFRFQRFEVRHDKSSMRVGTDAVLLGAWAETVLCNTIPQPKVLDIGCGCGVISMMVAQRCPYADVLGIDIDAPSIEEATDNAKQGIFDGRVKFRHVDVRDLVSENGHDLYDLILCNPPYYTEDTLPPEQRRSKARNALHLSFCDLLNSVSLLLSKGGVFAVIIPMQVRDNFVGEALKKGMHIRRECRVQTVLRKAPKRVLLEFDTQIYNNHKITSLTLQDTSGKRSTEYSALCKDFYL